jgi:RimJ/RimL family protein N-acetyltransferase
MIADHWPLFRLVLRTPRLELRLPDLDRLAELGELAAAGVHDSVVQPFAVAWTDGPPDQVVRSTFQFHWHCWSAWIPDDWALNLVAIADGRVVGTQSLGAENFGVLREAGTGSWVGRAEQGRGYGTEMRAAVLELAFTGLGAEFVTSSAFADNHASYRVSRKLGYVDNGEERLLVRGKPVIGRRLRIDRAGWEAARTIPVEIDGLEASRSEFISAEG